MNVLAISCPTAKVCWLAGAGPSDQPEVARTMNGGTTWKLATPADWASAAYSWWPNSIDCVSATTCWLAGETANGIQNPTHQSIEARGWRNHDQRRWFSRAVRP